MSRPDSGPATAGNQGADASLVTPAHVAGAITVGGFDQGGYFTSFSNYGTMVDILAPSVDVVSLQASTTGYGVPMMMTGTSMAAPHVTGAVALILSANPTANPSQIRATLLNNARTGTLLAGNTTDKQVWVGNF